MGFLSPSYPADIAPLLQVPDAGVVRLICLFSLPRCICGLSPRRVVRRPLIIGLLLGFLSYILGGGFGAVCVALQPRQLASEVCIRRSQLLRQSRDGF